MLAKPVTETETDAEDTDAKTQSDTAEEKKEIPSDLEVESIHILEKGSYEALFRNLVIAKFFI